MVEDLTALYPTQEDLLAAAGSCGWPRVEVRVPGRARAIELSPSIGAWQGFVRWPVIDGPARLAAWNALEEWEQALRTELRGARDD
jgi:hypothetical protein